MQKGGIQSINSGGVRGGFGVLRQNRGMGKYFCHPTVRQHENAPTRVRANTELLSNPL